MVKFLFQFLILTWAMPFGISIGIIEDAKLVAPLCSKEMQEVEKYNYQYMSVMRAAVCFHANKQSNIALQLYGHIRSSNPEFAYVLVNIAMVALKSGDPRKAIPILETYLDEVGGMDGDKIPTDQRALEKGPFCLKKSAFKSDCVNALNTIAAAHMSGNNDTAAIMYLKKAIHIGDEEMLGDVFANLGGRFAEIGDHESAAGAFLKSFWIRIRNGNVDPSPLIRRAIIVPTISNSLQDVEQVRLGFESRIKDLITLARYGGRGWSDDSSGLFLLSKGDSLENEIRQLPPLHSTISDWSNGIQSPHFYLHYYGFHDRIIQEQVAKMYELLCVPELLGVSPMMSGYQHSALILPLPAPLVPASSAQPVQSSQRRKYKLRIGFVSSHFGGDEPHGLLLIDVMRRLPKKIFEIIAVGIGTKQPSIDFLDATDEYFHVGYNDALARQVLISQQLDCLVFAEMQNEAIVHFLGYYRFAPIQILVMGAPVTSGNPSIDYFISGDRLEHPFRTHMTGERKHEEHYSEQVVLFDGQSISFPRDRIHPRQDSALAAGDGLIVGEGNHFEVDEYGIPKHHNASIYMCFQNLFKVQASFDFVLINILHADKDGHVVLQAARNAMRTEKISARIKSALSQSLCENYDPGELCSLAKETFSRIHFIPRVKSYQIVELFQRSSVILHPFPFGGSKTASDAIEAGVPIVTYPQKYLRGRMAASFFTSMALHEVDPNVAASSCCVASSVLDYVSKAVRMGRDRDYRDKVASAISARSYRIWDDAQTSFEWARFLARALGVNLDPHELSLEMKYKAESWQEEETLAREIEREQDRWRKSASLSKALNRY